MALENTGGIRTNTISQEIYGKPKKFANSNINVV